MLSPVGMRCGFDGGVNELVGDLVKEEDFHFTPS